MNEFIFAAPIWMLLTMLGVAVALVGYGFFRGDRTVRMLGLVVLLVSAVWLLASLLVETKIERVVRRSRELVSAVDRKDWDSLGQYLESGVTLSLNNRRGIYDGREQILNAGRLASAVRTIPKLEVGTIDPRIEGDLITTTVQVKTSSEATGGMASPTVWRFVWQRSGDEWHVREIEGIELGWIGSRVGQYFPRPESK